jgi:hypothetical protein
MSPRFRGLPLMMSGGPRLVDEMLSTSSTMPK